MKTANPLRASTSSSTLGLSRSARDIPGNGHADTTGHADTVLRASTTSSSHSLAARAMLSASRNARRRSSASDATIDFSAIEGRTSLFCPLPKRGFFYSRAYKEHKKKRKELKKLRAEHSDDGASSVDDEIPLTRDLTRRKRNSFLKKRHGELARAGSKVMESTNVSAFLAARIESERPKVGDEAAYDHGAPLLSGSMKSHMMDISLVGRDGKAVRSAKFVLACYSPVLEDVFFKGRESPHYQSVSDDGTGSRLSIGFCDYDVLRAASHHCFCGELPKDFSLTDTSEGAARNLAQLDHLAHVYKFTALGEVTYRALRKVINSRAVLACAVFDELSHRPGAGAVDSIKRYALDTLREMPMDTLLAGGVQWMKEESLEAIMRDQDMDVDEFYMFRILNAWAQSNAAERVPVARRLSRHIALKFVDPELLTSEVRESTYFAEKDVDEAVRLIKSSLEDRDQSEMERVLVEGAGTENVNGIYCRVEEEVGVSDEEILFVKEADDGYSDVGLYLWGTKWHIAMCADYSNCFYSCEDPPHKSSTELVPRSGWKVQYGGADPAPCCTYLPNTRVGRGSSSEKSVLAPNLEEMMDPTIAEKRRSGYFDKRTDDVVEKRTMTLEQMMNLPEDRGEIRDEQ